MEEKSQTPPSADTAVAASPGEPQRSAATTPPAPRRAAGGWLAGVALLLALLALAAVGWQLQRGADQREMMEFRLQSAIQAQVTALERLRERLADERAEGRSDRRDLRQQLEAQSAQLQQQAQRLSELGQSDRTDWRLAELDYLLKLARQRLLLGENPHMALELLESADTIARELDDPDLLPLRTALADDMAALRGLPPIDVEGIYFSLEAIASRVAGLQLQSADGPTPARRDDTAAETGAGEAWSERLRSGLADAWAKLSSLVQVRRRDEPYEPLLAPEFEASLRQHLLLLVEQAQLALVAGNQRLYSDSLNQAAEWAQRYFAVDQAATQAIVSQLQGLAGQAVSIDAPDIAGSQRALRDYLRDVARRRGEAVPAPAASESSRGGAESSATSPMPRVGA